MGYLVGRYVANKDKHTQRHPRSNNKVAQLPGAILDHVTIQ
jgi:hypothetical protein